ncbi:MAG: SpoIIIAC/SpoIIIAD family protein [Clostridia bacterium]|nr:SpoIIIAC/SpoIIIAD family protein [Clostridia bacterium]
MNEIMRIAGLGLTGGVLSIFIRRERPEFGALTALITSIIIFGQIISGVGDVANEIGQIANESGIDIKYFAICIKSIGIAYISQFAAEILRDGGEGAIASKVETAGKISILALTMPVLELFLRLCIRLVNEI